MSPESLVFRQERGILCAGKRFKGYTPIADAPVRKASVSLPPAMGKMMEAWSSLAIGPGLFGEAYAEAVRLVRGIRYTQRDVEGFGLFLAGCQHEHDFPPRAGILLSALVNGGRAKRYRLTIPEGMEVDYLGSANTKELLVMGDVRHGIGVGMESGKITVMGKASGSAGWSMKGGRLLIQGDCVEAGCSMTGGTIAIGGSAHSAGTEMEGGSIEVMGDCSIAGSRMKNGTLLIRGASRILGSYMSGGKITIIGDLPDDHKCEGMSGGELNLEGGIPAYYGVYTLDFKGGKIYHKGSLIAGG